jgi:superoxide dismutase
VFRGSAEFVKKFADVVATHDAANPMTDHLKPLLTCDLWEHAYYIDYRNDRAKYLQAFWKQVHWDFVERNLRGSPKPEPALQVASRH